MFLVVYIWLLCSDLWVGELFVSIGDQKMTLEAEDILSSNSLGEKQVSLIMLMNLKDLVVCSIIPSYLSSVKG